MDNETFSFGSFRLIPGKRVLLDGEAPLRLGSRAFDLLVALVERAGETVRNDELMARAWPDTVVDEGSVRVHLSTLRKVLGGGRSGGSFIVNIPGRGYRFVAPIERGLTPEMASRAPVATAGNLPAPLSRIIGRDEAIAKLTRQLAQCRCLTIVGPGGIGKTTVATVVARAAAPSYPDGVWFVGLASLPEPDLVPSAIGAALGISLPSGNPVAGLTAWLRDKMALVVLDSCESVIAAAAAVADAILLAAPQVRILATSREPLRINGEWRHHLAALAVPPDATGCTADEALRYSAVELFHDRASAMMGGLVLHDGDVPAVLEICRRLDGVPLALELAAAGVEAFGIKGLASRLDNRFAVLTAGLRTALPRHQTLRAAMDWSHDLLPASEQVLLRRLAMFQGDFTMDAALAVAMEGHSTAAGYQGIANLATKSLVMTDVSGEAPHYRLLDTTRAYALGKLAESGEREPLARRHADYYRRLLERAEAEWEMRPTAEWLRDYGWQIDNVRAALGWAFSPGGNVDIGIALTVAAIPLCIQLSLLEECRRSVERALGALAAGANVDPRREMKLQAALGTSLIWANDATVRALTAAWTRALEIAEQLDDTEYRLRSLLGVWYSNRAAGRLRASLTAAERFCALAASRSMFNDQLVGDRLIGLSQHFIGDQPTARRHLEHMLAHYVPPEQKSHVVRFLSTQRGSAGTFLARTLWLQGFPDQARRAAADSVNEARAGSHANSLCYVLADAGCPIALWTGDLDAADRYVATLIDLSTRYSLTRYLAFGRSHRGLLVIRRGDITTGLQLLRSGLDDLGEVNDPSRFFMYQGVMAETLGRAGHIGEGLAALDEAIARADETEERWSIAELLRIKGELLVWQGEPGAAAMAEDLFRQALDWASRQDALSWALRVATSFARLLRDQDRSADAKALLEPVYARFSEGFDTADLMAAKLLLLDLR